MPPEILAGACQPLPAHLAGTAMDCGFVRDGRFYRKDGLKLVLSAGWLELSDEGDVFQGKDLSPKGPSLAERGRPGEADLSVPADLGQPGLWKWVWNGEPPHRVFELPVWAVSDPSEDNHLDGSGPASFCSLLSWALETRQGRVPAGWRPPDDELVRGWLPKGALTVGARGHLCQGESLLSPERWALRVPILPRLAEDLPEPRRRALAALAADAQRHWAMVRVGLSADTSPAALVAEVDFTGAAHCELLFSAGLDVLRHVVAWLAETAAVVGEPSIELESLAAGKHNNPNERKMP